MHNQLCTQRAAAFALTAVLTSSFAHAQTTERVSVASGGAQGNAFSFNVSVSADGRFVAFASEATELVPGDTNNTGDVFVRDRQSGTTERVSVATSGVQGSSNSGDPSISADGRFVAFGASPRTSSPATRTRQPTSSCATA
jgi:Tol biopolymer transport system component